MTDISNLFSPIAFQIAREFRKRLLIHVPFEFDDGVERHPVFVPSPRIELVCRFGR